MFSWISTEVEGGGDGEEGCPHSEGKFQGGGGKSQLPKEVQDSAKVRVSKVAKPDLNTDLLTLGPQRITGKEVVRPPNCQGPHV